MSFLADTTVLGLSSLALRAYQSLPSLSEPGGEPDEPDERVDPAALVRFRSQSIPAHIPLNRRLRLLCLHGSGSNNDITRFHMVHTRICNHADCDLLHAPLETSAYSSDFHILSQLPFHAWWTGTLVPAHLARTLRLVLRHIERTGPYDGLFGFSQGAAVVSMLSLPGMVEALGGCAHAWRFVVCGCSAAVGLETAASLCPPPTGSDRVGLPGCIKLPSLHLIGRWDILCRSSSVQLAALYDSPAVYTHGNGHSLPAGLRQDKACAAAIDDFMARQQAAR